MKKSFFNKNNPVFIMKKTRAKKFKVRMFYHLQNLFWGFLSGGFLAWGVFVRGILAWGSFVWGFLSGSLCPGFFFLGVFCPVTTSYSFEQYKSSKFGQMFVSLPRYAPLHDRYQKDSCFQT